MTPVPVQHKHLTELEGVLHQILAAHARLLEHVEAHQAALKSMDTRRMDDTAGRQEACRLRVSKLDARRRLLTMQIATQYRLPAEPTLRQLAELFPNRRGVLLKLRDDLRSLVGDVSEKNKVSARVAGAVLGHLNTAVRLLAGAVERAGVYTKHGVPRVGNRIGLMEAVG